LTIEYKIGDCLELMKELPDKSVDLVLTDPPYGVGLDYGATYDDTEANWFKLMDAFIPEARRVGKMVVLPSCQIRRLPYIYQHYSPDWLICWYKGSPGHSAYIGFNDWEPLLVYGKNNTQMHDYFYCAPQPFNIGHPCPKSVDWAVWLIERCTKPGDTILDPFIGSGTTLLACRKTNRNGMGFEINPAYEVVIRERILEAIPNIESWDSPEIPKEMPRPGWIAGKSADFREGGVSEGTQQSNQLTKVTSEAHP
jgi:DNA modification methylase